MLSTASSESCITCILPLITEFMQSVSWSDHPTDCFSLVECLVQLSSRGFVSSKPNLLCAVFEPLFNIFYTTCHLSSRPVRVHCLIEMLCHLSDTHYRSYALNAALKLSFDRVFRLGLLNYEDSSGLSKLVLPLLHIPDPFSGDQVFFIISRLQKVISLLANLANSTNDARSVIDRLAGPDLTNCLRFLYHRLNQTKRQQPMPLDGHNALEFTPSQRSLVAGALRQIIVFLSKLVEAGDIIAVCNNPNNLPIIFTIAFHWYLKRCMTNNHEKREHEDNSYEYEATVLLQLIVGDIRLCNRILQPKNGFLKQLLFLALSSGNKSVLKLIAKLAQQSLIVPIEYSNQTVSNGVTEWEQHLLLWAFALGFLDLPLDVSFRLQKRLLRHSSVGKTSGVDQLLFLANRFSNSLDKQEHSSKWAQLVWTTFASLFAYLIKSSATLPNHDKIDKLTFHGSTLSANDTILTVIVTSVFAHFHVDANSCDEFQESVRRLLVETFESDSSRQSSDSFCAYQAWFYDELDLTKQCIFSFAPVNDKVTVALVGSDWHHDLIGSAPWETWRIPVSPASLSFISPFFEAIFSMRWEGEEMQVIPITTVHMSRESRALWPLGPLLVIIHLAAGCQWQCCRFLRDLNKQLLEIPVPSSWRGPSEHAAQLIGLADRLLFSSDGTRHWFGLHKYLFSSLINLHSSNQTAAFRTLFTTCLRLSVFLDDHALLTALLWLALADARWSCTTTPKQILQRPLASCLHNLFEYRTFWREIQNSKPSASEQRKFTVSSLIRLIQFINVCNREKKHQKIESLASWKRCDQSLSCNISH